MQAASCMRASLPDGTEERLRQALACASHGLLHVTWRNLPAPNETYFWPLLPRKSAKSGRKTSRNFSAQSLGDDSPNGSDDREGTSALNLAASLMAERRLRSRPFLLRTSQSRDPKRQLASKLGGLSIPWACQPTTCTLASGHAKTDLIAFPEAMPESPTPTRVQRP